MPVGGINSVGWAPDRRTSIEKILDPILTVAKIVGTGTDVVEGIKNGKVNREAKNQEMGLANQEMGLKLDKETREQQQTDFNQGIATKNQKLEEDKSNLDNWYKHQLVNIANKKTGMATSRQQNPFLHAADVKEGQKYADTQMGGQQADEQLTLIDDSLDALKNYSKNTMFGTGPAATAFGLKKYVDQDTQNLEAKFRMINLKNLAKTFQGMSRAVDSEVERRAWEATQPSLSNDDIVNSNILLGAKALAMKGKMEAQAQKFYVENSENHSLQGYETPILGKTKALMKDGEMVIVPNEKVKEALNSGYETLDHYSLKTFGVSNHQKQVEVPPEVKHMSTDDLWKALK